MNFVSIEHVLQIAKKRGCKVWSIRDAEKNLLDSGDGEIDESLQALRECYNAISGSYVCILLSPQKQRRGGDTSQHIKFYVQCQAPAAPALVPAKNSFPFQKQPAVPADFWMMFTDVKVQLANQQKDIEIRELQRKLSEKETRPDRSKMLEKYLEKLLMQQPAAAISGTQTAAPATAATPANKPATQQRLVKVLNRLQRLDKENWLTVLEKLADFAEKNPAQFKQYLEML